MIIRRLVILLNYFTWKWWVFPTKSKQQQKLSKEAKTQGKRLNVVRKNHLDKNN